MAALMERIALDPGTIVTLRARLRADRETATAMIESTKESMASANNARRDAAVDDEHDPEGATHALQFAESSALLEHSRRNLDLINTALNKMSRGLYGCCEMCGVDIAMARLEARPFAPHCIRCAIMMGL